MDQGFSNKCRRFAKGLMAVLFFGFLWLPAFEAILGFDKTTQVNENRLLAPWPQVSRWSEVRPFISGLERYFNDHFGFRKRLIYWAQTWKREWLKETWQSRVIVGQNGWLYSTASDDPLEERRRTSSVFTQTDLRAWKTVFESRRDWLARRNIKYLLVFPPDKQTIYPEHLPSWVASVRETRKLDQLLQFMRTNSTVSVVDLAPVLLESKSVAPVYLLTDSHWNQFGAFIACNELIRALSKQLPDLKPLSLEGFDRTLSTQPGGNLAWMLTGAKRMTEHDVPSLVPKAGMPPLRLTEINKGGALIHHSENPVQKGKALLFCDSFADGMLPFLAYHFKEVTSYRIYQAGDLVRRPRDDLSPAHVWIPTIIDEENPDVVIDEILEGLFYMENPETLKHLDALK